MFETALIACQSLALALPAAWLAIGVFDNIRHPELNGSVTAQVMDMRRMREEFPEDFARVAHRAITSAAIQRALFRVLVCAELAVMLALWIAVLALLWAFLSGGDAATARALALVAATGFTAIWAGFLIVGNYFCYWYCHEGAQNTHFQMTLWGLGTAIFMGL